MDKKSIAPQSPLVALALALLIIQAGAVMPPKEGPWTTPKEEMRSNQLIVKLTPGTKPLQASEHDMKLVAELGESTYVYEVAAGRSLLDKVAELSRITGVTAAPNYVRHRLATPDDVLFYEQWHLTKVFAPKAWDVTTGSSKVKVCVVDDGYTFHPDLDAQINKTHSYNAVEGEDPNAWRGDRTWVYGHGVHVAGILGAVANNFIGIVGVAWNVQLHICRIFPTDGGATDADIVKCLRKCREWGTHMTTNSWGGYGFSRMLYEEFAKDAEQNMLCVAAAGNEELNSDLTPSYPSGFDLPNILSVAASTPSEVLASFSNWGKARVDLAAPGIDILSSVPGGYEAWAGTSMATPVVTGAAVLLQAQALATTGKTLGYAAIKSRLLNNVDKLPCMAGKVKSGGRLNILAALNNTPRSPTRAGCFTIRQGLFGTRVNSTGQAVDCGTFTALGARDSYMVAAAYVSNENVWVPSAKCQCFGSKTKFRVTTVMPFMGTKAEAVAKASLVKEAVASGLFRAYQITAGDGGLYLPVLESNADAGTCVVDSNGKTVWGKCPASQPVTAC